MHTDVKIQYIAASLYHGIRGDKHDLSLFGTDHFARAFAADPDMVQQYLDVGKKLGVGMSGSGRIFVRSNQDISFEKKNWHVYLRDPCQA